MWIHGKDIDRIGHAVAVRVGVGVVADAIAIEVRRFAGIIGKRIAIVANAIVVAVGGFVGIVGERIGVVADAIAIRVRGIVRVVGAGIAVVANAVAIAVGGLRGVERECVVVVPHPVAVVVRIGGVADAVAIGVLPLLSIVGEGILGVDDAVLVDVRLARRKGGDLEAHGVQAGDCVGAVGFADVDAAGQTVAIAVRVGESVREPPPIGHDRASSGFTVHIVAAGPAEGTLAMLFG